MANVFEARPKALDHHDDLERLMTVDEVADYLSVPVNTLYQWRHKGTGPTAFRVGRFLRYDLTEVRDWLYTQAGVHDGTR